MRGPAAGLVIGRPTLGLREAHSQVKSHLRLDRCWQYDKMPREKIKCKRLIKKDKKLRLLLLCSKEIQVTKAFDATDGFAVLTLNEEHADSVFTRELRDEVERNGYQPNMPPELKVKKTIIIRVDNLIYDWKEQEIPDEFILRNAWIGDELDFVFKFPNSSTIKVTFTQAAVSKKSTERGPLAFSLSIPPSDIRQETFIPIKCCMKSYKREEHNTKECPKDQEYKICSRM